MFDAQETKKGYDIQSDGTKYIRVEVLGNDRFYVRMTMEYSGPASYELALQAAADN